MIWALPNHFVVFPHPLTADEEGVLAWSEYISPEQVVFAYRYGIFPWYSAEDPILWWYPNPRFVLNPNDVRIHKSMRQFIRKTKLQVTFNTKFEEVIESCRTNSRTGQDSTWIHDETVEIYSDLHRQGYAHSVEVWDEDNLVGGLYGLAIGKIFFGESMFTKVSNASKLALIHLCKKLNALGFELIDCQQETEHLKSLGAQPISKEQFYSHLRNNQLFTLQHGDFHF